VHAARSARRRRRHRVLRRHVRGRRPAPPGMSATTIGLCIAVLVAVYLLVALLRPERF
jgi:K+-transporting ATPase KdpF subunit